MRQRVRPGGEIDTVTPHELHQALDRYREPTPQIVRATENIVLDGTGSGQDEVFAVPMGYELRLRRVFLNLSSAVDPSTGNVALNAAGKYVQYLRSGALIAYAMPVYGPALQVPGSENWGDQQGPYLVNGEVFEVKAAGLTPNASLVATIQGVLTPTQQRQ